MAVASPSAPEDKDETPKMSSDGENEDFAYEDDYDDAFDADDVMDGEYVFFRSLRQMLNNSRFRI